ncbi:MAG: PHP domain-containing protein [Chloroflexi bacterium]|nr:PHP domain-containing protein [Chloroflexota bacterium]
MGAQVDLHMHSTYSDGTLKPAELIAKIGKTTLKVIALTDHDTTQGLDEATAAAKAFPHLTIIPGVEISTEIEGGEVHILAYYVNKADAGFQKELERFRASRYERGQKMVEKLAELGMPLSWKRVLEVAGDGAVGRPHVARALIEKGYVASHQEAFDKYLAKGQPAYVEREKLTPEEAIGLAVRNGALPVLAHPAYVKEVEKIIPSLKAAGLVGMEVYYSTYSEADTARFKMLADQHGLVPCGGSDYHGNGYAGEVEPGVVGPPMSTAERLKAMKAAKR